MNLYTIYEAHHILVVVSDLKCFKSKW